MANWGKKIRHRFSKKQEYTEVSAYKISKFTRREIIMTIVTVLAITSFALGTSYAIFSDIETSSNYNIVEAGNLEIAFDHTEDGIGNVLSLNNAYPMSDSDGLLQTGYTFKVENTGSLNTIYTVKILDDTGMIEADGCASNILDKSKIRVSVDGGLPITLSTLEANNWIIQTGSLAPTETATHTIKMWIDINSGNEILGKHYHGKILVEAVNEEPPTPTDESCFTFASGTITAYSSDPSCPKDVIIPETIKGETVTMIGRDSFAAMGITSVYLPSKLQYIGDASFMRNELQTISIPSNVTVIGQRAFEQNQLTSVIIPSSVNSIGYQAFGYNQLTSVILEEGIEQIMTSAFFSNELTSITIPSTITNLYNYSFASNELTSIIISEGATGISGGVFVDNKMSDEEAFIYDIKSDGTIDYTTLNSYAGAKKEGIVIPDNIVILKSESFISSNIVSVVIPDSVTTIGDYAFNDNQLTEVVIPNSVTTIGFYAFAYNSSLCSIRILGKSSESEFTSLGSEWNGTCTNIIYEP